MGSVNYYIIIIIIIIYYIEDNLGIVMRVSLPCGYGWG
jgi:hypothetical protein